MYMYLMYIFCTCFSLRFVLVNTALHWSCYYDNINRKTGMYRFFAACSSLACMYKSYMRRSHIRSSSCLAKFSVNLQH